MAKLKDTSVAGNLTVTGKVTSSVAGATTSTIGTVKLNSATNSTSTTEAATPSAVKAAYDLANGKANASHGNHVPATETVNNAKFLRNDNTWQTVTPANIGAAAASHGTHVSYGGNGSATTVSRSDHTHSYVPTSTGGNIIVHADSESSSASEYAQIKAGHNVLQITSSAGGGTVTQGNNKITFNGHAVYHAGQKPSPADIGAATTAAATTSANGLMTKEMVTKLNGIATGANAYVHPGSGTNPHGTTKSDVGLGSVNNWGASSTISANSTSQYATTNMVAQVRAEKLNASGGAVGGQLYPSGNQTTELGRYENKWSTVWSRDLRCETVKRYLPSHPSDFALEFGCGVDGADYSFWASRTNGLATLNPKGNNGGDLGAQGCSWKELWLRSWNRTENGYTYLPNGLLLQWGKAVGTKTVNFPIAFPNACLHVEVVGMVSVSSNPPYHTLAGTGLWSKSSFPLITYGYHNLGTQGIANTSMAWTATAGTPNFGGPSLWMAIGY